MRKYIKKPLWVFFPPYILILFSVPVADYRNVTCEVAITKRHVGNTIHSAVPEIKHTIAVHTDGVIAISVPVVILRDYSVIPYRKTTAAVLS